MQTSVRGQNGVEFHHEFNGHGPRHMICVLHVLTHDLDIRYDFVTPEPFELQTSDKLDRISEGIY